MVTQTVAALVFVACMVCFFLTNLYNILKLHRDDNDSKPHPEIARPSGLLVYAAGAGTLIYFVEATSYGFHAFAGFPHIPNDFSLGYEFPFAPYAQVLGIILTVIGYALFIWSVIARGKHAVSWTMGAEHRLVTWGPYRYTRHPSYLGYFLMFIGFAATVHNLLAFVPLIAIPGYFKVTSQEEKMLQQHFGDEYDEYRRKTGRFLPKP